MSLLVVGDSRRALQRVTTALNQGAHPRRLVFAADEGDVLLNLAREPCELIVAQRACEAIPALRLLDLLRTRRIDVPVIVFSEEHTEEELVEVMRAGARDCLGKGSLGRLGACVERELDQAAERRAAPPRDADPQDGYRALVEEIPALIYVAWADHLGSRAYLGPQLETMTGFKPVEWLAEPDAWIQHLHPDDRERVLHEFRESCGDGQAFVSEYRVQCRDDRIAWWRDQGRVVRDDAGRAKYVRGFIQDVTEQKAAAETIQRMRFYDVLTGLPNRRLLQDRLSQALAESTRDARPISLLILALDRFREINNTLGHENGDLIIRQLAQRLSDVLGGQERVARLRGDEFGMLLPGSDVGLAGHVGGKILGALERPFMVQNLPIEVGASVGIAAAPEHGQEAEILLRRADLAMQEAKRLASGCVVYSAGCDPYDPGRLTLLGELRRAIEADQLSLFYQPKVDVKTRRVVGAEALVRWRHPKRGLVPPGDFIPLAEQAGVIRPLTWWVLREAVRQCRAWDQAGLGLDVAVNLSARSLHDPQLTERITDLLGAHDVSPQRLQIEVTESAVMTDPARAAEILAHLGKLGVGVSIDDFGTGYSSLTYLRNLPVSEIKIDKSFVIGMSGDGGPDQAIVRSTSELGHNLGLRVVAEGVEDETSFELLRSYTCDMAQGYYIARPMAADALGAWRRDSPWCRPADS